MSLIYNAIKLIITISLIIFNIYLSVIMVLSLDDEKYGLVLVLTCVFLVTATLMNRFAESYGN